ncbi:DUF397 domain-containing protein [Actinomadura atramentaria]|nr:DUF397 domain-containing protein [Actinomadura atramentaria]
MSGETTWRVSSHSSGNGACVEVRDDPATVRVRETAKTLAARS